MVKLHFIAACHNRRVLTTKAVADVESNATCGGVLHSFTLYDDGSTDGTSEAIRKSSPATTIIKGDGSAFWAKSMALAESFVLSDPNISDEDYVVWLNDDVQLDKDAVSRAVRLLRQNPNAVLASAMRDPEDSSLTYTGFRKIRLHPLRLVPVAPTDVVQQVDTFNGNLVFVPVPVARAIGGIDGEYAHALADIDYGLRCRKLDIELLLAPGTFGICPKNPPAPEESIWRSWSRFLSAKGGGHTKSMKRILKKTNRFTWFLFMLSTYTLWWIRAINRSVKKRVRMIL